MPAVLHKEGYTSASRCTSTKNSVVPYMSIISPGSLTPTLSASDQASIVPAATGIPAGRPVSAAADGVTRPATSEGQSSLGSAKPGAISPAHSPIQLLV